MSKKNKKIIDPNILNQADSVLENNTEDDTLDSNDIEVAEDVKETLTEVSSESSSEVVTPEDNKELDKVVEEPKTDEVKEEPKVEEIKEVISNPETSHDNTQHTEEFVKQNDNDESWFEYLLTVKETRISLEELAEKIKANRKAGITDVTIDEGRQCVIIYKTNNFNDAVKKRKYYLGCGVKSVIVEVPVD